jgi:2-polyprenyl-3-methyl-5-hydroxy-6-metoxy-1,4-benzoquinol methylase
MSEDTGSTCRVCGNATNNTRYQVREMLHGTREPFSYFQCGACGCLQIESVPEDLARHYPADYQAYKDYHRRARNRLRRFIDSRRVRYELTGQGMFGRMMTGIAPPLDYVHWCRQMGLTQASRILDVGCGNGKLITRMLAGGFSHLRGIDLFIDRDISFPPQAIIYKTDLPRYLKTSPGQFDLVMLHHSFEHMDNPREVLNWCSQLIADDGWLLIRVPLADSQAWEQYRENWFALDPPRHLYLHTSASMSILAGQCGFKIVREERDAAASQFVQSEWYVRDIPANAPKENRALFSSEQIREFDALSRQLNESGKGDQGAFFLKKARASDERA